MQKILFFLTAIISVMLCRCSGSDRNETESSLEYAALITISEEGNGTRVTLSNPWKDGKNLQSYLLSETMETQYSYGKSNGTVHVPAKRAVVMSNSHCRLLSELGVADCIAGICETEYITDSIICAYIGDGRITDCGNSMNPDIERIIELHPDVILVSPFEECGYGQLEKLGIPLIECSDYMEPTPLGRAEWIKFFSNLFGVAQRGDSLFNSVRDKYISLSQAALQYRERPKVLLDTKGGSAWYMAGGSSTIGQMISDAGGDYILSGDNHSGSLPLSFESVFDKGGDADIWLLKNSTTHELTYELLAEDYNPYTRFKPYMSRCIWVCDVYSTPYFEMIPFHPELLLEDLISIFHPTYGRTAVFYHPME